MGTPFVIIATGQSNIFANGNGVPFNWSPSPRTKVWNNVRDNDNSVGNAFSPISSALIDSQTRYANNVAVADPNKDVYLASYARGGRCISCWVGGEQHALDYTATGAGKIYLNNPSPSSVSAMWISRYDVYGAGRRNTGNDLFVGESIWLKQGTTIIQYRIDSFTSDAELNLTVYVTPLSVSGALNTSTAVQVEFQPRFLREIENSVPSMLAAAGKSTIDILIWWQGESDAGFNTRYESEFNFVMSYLGAKPWWGANTKILICGTNNTANSGYPYLDAFNDTLNNLTVGYSNRYFCNSAANLPKNRWSDTFHPTAQGFADIGDLLFNNVYAPPISSTPTYSVVPSSSSVVEGSSVTFSVSTTNVANGTLFWTNAGTTTAADFADGQNSGSFAVTNNAGSIARTLTSDSSTEGTESIVIQIRTGSTAGPIVATSTSVSVTDPSSGGGTGSITGMSAGALTLMVDVQTNGNRQLINGIAAYGLWLDGSIHPYKDASGNTYVLLPHSESYRFQIGNWNNGSTWALQGPTYTSARDVTEGYYNNRHWVFGVWGVGSTMYALTHHEWYQSTITVGGVGGWNARNYVEGQQNTRWVNGIGWASSSNNGLNFNLSASNSSSRMVVVPEPWGVQSKDHMYGFFHPSNIVQEGSYYYAAIEQRSLDAAGTATNSGVSLIRTTNLATPTGWEFWSGSAWVAINHNTYQGNLSSQAPHRFFPTNSHNYYVLPNDYNSHMGQNLRYHVPTNQWLMFGFAGSLTQCIAYSTSPTLANPQFATLNGITNPNPNQYNSSAARYISVFDENSSDRNFMNLTGNTCTVLVTNGVSEQATAETSYSAIYKGTITITTSSTPPPTPTYSVNASTLTVNEGGSVTFTVTTTNVGSATLFWTNSGTTNGADFTDGVNSGSISLVNNSATFTRTLSNDVLLEGGETISIQIRAGSTGGTIVATALTVTVNDTSVPSTASYSVSPSVSNVNEGQTVTFNISTTNVPNGTLYWTNSGTAVAADFSDGQNSGSFVLTNNSGSFSRTLLSDALTEGAESIVMQIRTGSTGGTVVATSSTVTVNDSTAPTNPTYSVSPTTLSISEGSVVTFNVTTTNVGSATLYWTNAGTTTGADFVGGANSGSVVITNNSGSFSLTVATDALVESAETLIIQIRTVSSAGSVVATASTVTVNNVPVPQAGSKFWIRGNSNSWIDGASASVLRFRNTSSWVDKAGNLAGLAVRNAAGNDWIYFISQAAPTYNLSASATNVNEGQSVTFNVITTNFGTGTLYWTTSGTAIAADFSDGVLAGSVSIVNNVGSIVRTMTNDLTTEGTESFTLSLRTDSIAGSVVATSPTVTINDTSVPSPPSYSISPSVTSVNEGGSVTFTVSTTNVANGTLYWTNAGTTTAADFTNGVNSGATTITNNAGSIVLGLVSDLTSEGGETIVIQIRTGSTAGPVVVTSQTVIVVDTSVPAAPTYSISASTNSVNEGGTVTFPITTTNVGSTTLYWTNAGTTSAADFVGSANSGSVAISGNSGSISRTLVNDSTTEGGETIAMQLRTGSTAGPVVATSPTVIVVDTSVPSVPTSLTMARNNLDFFYLPDYNSSQQGTLDVRVTITTTNFFNYATNAFDHIPIAIDCAGGAGNNDPHCGPVIRNGRNLWVTARGFFITRSSGVWSELWNGTSSPVIAQLTNTSGQVFNPISGTYTVRIRAGYQTGPYANLMTITITNGTGIYDPVVFQGSAGIGGVWNGFHRVCLAAIATGFVGPTPSNGCVEPSGAGSAVGGTVPFSGFSVTSY